MTREHVAVVVVNHNTREHLRRCLLRILAERPAQTIVVDTGSRDLSGKLVRDDFPGVELVEMENRGYAAAANVGVGRAHSRYAVILNADTLPARGSLEALASYLDARPRVAVAGPRIVNQRGRREVSGRPFPSPFQILLQESGLHRIAGRKHRYRPAGRVDWVLGAAIAVRRAVVIDAGGFDESYFMYNEEIDLCLRLHHVGWEVHYVPFATVEHLGGASSSQNRATMVEQYVRSTILLYERHRSRREQAQLRLVLDAALTARSVRDRLRLFVTRDRALRYALLEQLAAWRSARAALRPS